LTVDLTQLQRAIIERRDRPGATDLGVRVWAREWEAVNAPYEGRPLTEAASLAEEAVAIGGQLVSAGMAGALSGSAQALAGQGRADEASAALAQLRTLVERLPDTVVKDEDSMAGWPEVRLRHTASYVYTHLGQTAMAYAEQDRAFALYPPELARERAQLQMHRAACLVLDGDVTAGLDDGHHTLDELPRSLHNEMLFERARHLLSLLPPMPDDSRTRCAAEDLRSRLVLTPAIGS
jgi:hypothetical protein